MVVVHARSVSLHEADIISSNSHASSKVDIFTLAAYINCENGWPSCCKPVPWVSLWEVWLLGQQWTSILPSTCTERLLQSTDWFGEDWISYLRLENPMIHKYVIYRLRVQMPAKHLNPFRWVISPPSVLFRSKDDSESATMHTFFVYRTLYRRGQLCH